MFLVPLQAVSGPTQLGFSHCATEYIACRHIFSPSHEFGIVHARLSCNTTKVVN